MDLVIYNNLWRSNRSINLIIKTVGKCSISGMSLLISNLMRKNVYYFTKGGNSRIFNKKKDNSYKVKYFYSPAKSTNVSFPRFVRYRFSSSGSCCSVSIVRVSMLWLRLENSFRPCDPVCLLRMPKKKK